MTVPVENSSKMSEWYVKHAIETYKKNMPPREKIVEVEKQPEPVPPPEPTPMEKAQAKLNPSFSIYV